MMIHKLTPFEDYQWLKRLDTPLIELANQNLVPKVVQTENKFK